VDNREIKERLDKIEKENKKIRRENQHLKQIIKKAVNTGSQNSNQSQERVSRREFLKKLGAGAIGLGALSLAPAASKVTISDTGITKNGQSFWNQENLNPESYLNRDGTVSMTGDLNLGNYQITNLADPTADNDAVNRGWAQTEFASTNHGNTAHSEDYTTLTEVNNNADVPNADHADEADTLDGNQAGELLVPTGSINQSDSFGGNYRSMSGSGETIHSLSLSGEGADMNKCVLDISHTFSMGNESGSGGYPDVGLRIVDSTGIVNDYGTVGTNNDTSFNATFNKTNLNSKFNLTFEVYDAGGGGGYNDVLYSSEITVSGDTTTLY